MLVLNELKFIAVATTLIITGLVMKTEVKPIIKHRMGNICQVASSLPQQAWQDDENGVEALDPLCGREALLRTTSHKLPPQGIRFVLMYAQVAATWSVTECMSMCLLDTLLLKGGRRSLYQSLKSVL